MEEEFPVTDPAQLLEAASNFANHPGVQTDCSVKEFFDRFPLPVILSALQMKAGVPGLEDTLVACLERIFRTKYGASFIQLHMPFLQVGLRSESQKVRFLACKTVSCLVVNISGSALSASQLITKYDLYPLLLDCLVQGDENVMAAAMEAITNLSCSPGGMALVFPADVNEATHFRNLAARCSPLGRIRVLALIVKLFAVSSSVASVISKCNLLGLLVEEVTNANDTLVILSVLELLYELAEIEHGAEFSSKTTLLQLLSSMISETKTESIIRSRAMTICGRLLCKENAFLYISESDVQTVIMAIDGRIGSLNSQEADESEAALEALGQIGSSKQGAILLLTSAPLAARHVIEAAFDRGARGMQLAALHTLGNISGETRSENSIMLNDIAEECLQQLIYATASQSSKFTPSGLFLSVLQKDSEFRLAGYRLITGLVTRPWCLVEICSKPEIITRVTDPYAESSKIGMETKYKCCKAIGKAFASSSKLLNDPAFAGITAKLREAVERGPYLARKQTAAQPAVMAEHRF